MKKKPELLTVEYVAGAVGLSRFSISSNWTEILIQTGHAVRLKKSKTEESRTVAFFPSAIEYIEATRHLV